MLFKFKRIMGCIEPWVKNRDTNRIVSWCIVTALVNRHVASYGGPVYIPVYRA